MSVTEIASRAGVSQATVSKVINNYPSVSAESAQRVRAVMREMNYTPPKRKRGDSATDLVALLIFPGLCFRDFRTSFNLMVHSIDQSLSHRNMGLVVSHVSSVDELPEIVRRNRVSGLLLQGRQPDDSVLSEIDGIPSVWLSSREDQGGKVLLEGNESVGRLAAEYLISRGHTRLGVINALADNPVEEARCSYFRFVAENAGCSVEQFLDEGSSQWSHGQDLDLDVFERHVEQQVRRFMDTTPAPTGLYVPLDFQLAMVYRILQREGVVIKDRFDFIGSDDERSSLMGLYPRPATINVGPREMGAQAVKELCWQIEHGESDRRVRISIVPELVPGD